MYRRRKRNRRAQRPYQITRYRIPNVLNPDELIMKIKWNHYFYYNPVATLVERIELPVNGATIAELQASQNFNENAARFNQIEFLSGKLSLYIINEGLNNHPDTGAFYPTYLMIGMHTRRRWFDANLVEQSEAIIPKPDFFTSMWTQSAETPGYSVRLVNYITSGKGIQKLAFRASKESFRTLKANPTSFQQNLPLDTSDPNIIYPSNVMNAFIDITDIDSSTAPVTVNRCKILVSRTLLVRFKGAITH